ncbi:hypothetical protein QAD02_015259 [Eretmocerus hayati]|uniref:Uncharacterized protein n=1 Tax=Eretmocerus hayati TaxID=131215 RepID=A0ACC2P7R3_9HYME|nr:hypothetical protein QAD02_015259 [Eretmocerus hayati]
MDQSIPVVNGVSSKSPGKSSPVAGMGGGQGIGGPGRTMKECEEELGALKKENFRLKLRIYHLEERMGISSADEDTIKKNIELKEENESLKKELIEKQELLSQAAKAIELIEEQKQVSARNQAQYQQTLEQERDRADKLERELEEYRSRLTDATYYEETFGITPEKALEYKDKLHQVEEIKSSLEFELKQVSASLEEERNYAQELENERDLIRNRLEAEMISKEKLTAKRDREMEALNERLKDLEDQVFKKDNALQQLKKEVVEKDKLIEEKTSSLEEKSRAYEEVSAVAEKRKKHVEQLRVSIKSRDDALTDLNNKNRALLAQLESNCTRQSTSPVSPSVYIEESRHFRKTFDVGSPTKSHNGSLDLEPSIERCKFVTECHSTLDRRDSPDFKKELEEKEREIKRQEETKKQLMLKLNKVQQSSEETDQKLKKLEVDHRKAIQMIQGFMGRHQQMEDKQIVKDRRIMELEVELNRLRNDHAKAARSSMNCVRRNISTELIDGPERDSSGKQRFEEMESKINDLRDQIDDIKAEKSLLQRQIEIKSEELNDRLQDKDLKIECLECEKNCMKDELQNKNEELDKLRDECNRNSKTDSKDDTELKRLRQELCATTAELLEKKEQIECLTKELQSKTLNLQQLVNTELWSKNKEIAKFHNHITASQNPNKNQTEFIGSDEFSSSRLNALVKELNAIGIQVAFTNNIIQLNYVNSSKPVEISTMTDYINKLLDQKDVLEKEVDYLKWFKVVSKQENDIETEICAIKDKHYCELLRTHLKELVRFMKEMLQSTDQTPNVVNSRQKKIVFDALMKSKILSNEFIHALDDMNSHELAICDKENKVDGTVRKSKSENHIDARNHLSNLSDSETFSEPDRMVSLARMGLPEMSQKSPSKSRSSKLTKSFSDSEESVDGRISHESSQREANEVEASRHILELKNVNDLLHSDLSALRVEVMRITSNDVIDSKFALLLSKIEKSRMYCEKLQNSLERKIYEPHLTKKESKSSSRRGQLERKIADADSGLYDADQTSEIIQHKDRNYKRATDLLVVLSREGDLLKTRIRKLEDENEAAKSMILRLTRELDHLTLTHSQILVENTKLTNDKLRLEQEVRKSENRYEVAVRNLQEKFHKEVTDLNQIIDSHRSRIQELETNNKDLRRHVVVCEASDSAPSSSGISSIPHDNAGKPDDLMHGYHSYNGSQYWLPVTYPASSGRSKSSCSPDLGIESDAVTSTRPLKDTLKITESMTNLLSDDDNCNNNPALRDMDDDCPLPIEGGLFYYSLDEVQTLKQENIALKRRLMKTRRALEDTFQHLSASNKNKKNVEKAISQQLQITKSILKKTRNFEETPFES